MTRRDALALAAACTAAGTLSAVLELHFDIAETLIVIMLELPQHLTVHAIAIAAVAALAIYLHSLSETQRFNPRTAIIRIFSGGVWGLIAAKAGAGVGLGPELQTAAAGVAGAKGPEYMDRIADRIIS